MLQEVLCLMGEHLPFAVLGHDGPRRTSTCGRKCFAGPANHSPTLVEVRVTGQRAPECPSQGLLGVQFVEMRSPTLSKGSGVFLSKPSWGDNPSFGLNLRFLQF